MTRLLLASVALTLVLPDTSGNTQDLPDEIRVGTWNLEWFYDHQTGDNRSQLAQAKSAPTKEDWDWKLNNAAKVIARHRPYIMALQEVENREVLFELRNRLKQKHGLSYRIAFVQGFDSFTEQDVGILFRNGLVEMSRREQNEEQWQSQEFYNLSKHLIGRFEWGRGEKKKRLTLINLHLRALAKQEPLRIRQVRFVRSWIDESVGRGENVIIVGDLNSEHKFGTENRNSDIGTLRGLDDSEPNNDLVDAHASIAKSKRGTHLTGKQYDRILYSPAMATDRKSVSDLVFQQAFVGREGVIVGDIDKDNSRWENMYSIPIESRDISDHYPVFADFEFK